MAFKPNLPQADRVPRHVAIIMDGNGRWAQKRGRPRVFGHIRGASRISPILLEAKRLGVRALTVFAFSTENWSRPPTELEVLWKLLGKWLQKEVRRMERENVRLRVIGELERLPKAVRELTDQTIARLAGNTGIELTLALSYGSRDELCRAARRFAEDCATGKHRPEDMCAELMGEYLWTSALGDLSDVDLVIRTSGEQRLSNFLLWQAAYAEFIFVSDNWPDFGTSHLREAVREYANRERRYGGLKVPALVLQSAESLEDAVLGVAPV